MSTTISKSEARERECISTGIRELDYLLGGGLAPHHLYLVEGTPGAGKTTLALQFLLEGVRRGERTLYVTLSESRQELHDVARSHGWSLEGIEIYEMVDPSAALEPESQYTMFQPAEIELGVATNSVLNEVDRIRPSRIVFDSLAEMRLLSQNSLRYRRQVLGLKQYFGGKQCTVVLLDDKTFDTADLQLHSIVHGVIVLEQLAPEYGAERRRLQITKLRGTKFRGGYHDFVITRGGLSIHPRLVAADYVASIGRQQMKSGINELDELLGGGIERGSSVLLMGPAGVGKSSVGTQYAFAAAQRGERAAIFVFDESRETLLHRSRGLNMELEPYIESGLITIQQVDPAELSPGEFAFRVRQAVEGSEGHPPASVIIIDSLNGYMNAMPEERFLVIQLHELLTYLGNLGVNTFLVVAQTGLIGTNMGTPVDTSYLADIVVLFRYFEARGEVLQAISVVKKRSGHHERTIREFKLSSEGIQVGPALREFHGVLSGVPVYQGSDGNLLRRHHD
jgi:circadian clock protein KaiC